MGNKDLIIHQISKNLLNAADVLEGAARKLRKENESLLEKENTEWCGEYINIITNVLNNVRLDLFATYPARQLERMLNESDSIEGVSE